MPDMVQIELDKMMEHLKREVKMRKEELETRLKRLQNELEHNIDLLSEEDYASLKKEIEELNDQLYG